LDNISEAFVNRLYELANNPIPNYVIEKVKECFCDYLAVVYGGSTFQKGTDIDYIKNNSLNGNNHIFGCEISTDIYSSAMINAYNAHYLELDDSHRVAMTHLGAPIFSALISIAELKDLSLSDVLNGAIIGYEAAIRIASAIQPGHKKNGFHVSGTCCTIGCAMGISAMLHYSESEMNNVISAAGTTAAGLLEIIGDESEQKPFNVANAALSGIESALFGKIYIGARDILGGNRGLFKAMASGVDYDKLSGDDYAIMSIYQKLYASCRHCHAPIEAALNALNENNISLENIELIEIQTYELAIKGHDHKLINCMSSAKQSIPYSVVAAIVFGRGDNDIYNDSVIGDERIVRLLDKTILVENPELSAMVPQKRPAIVRIITKDGQEYTNRVDYAKGEPENPISREELHFKYSTLMKSAGISDSVQKKIYDVIFSDDNISVRDLMKILFGESVL
jgi:Uncharacterized protein involved in propionate catabolism